MSRIPKYQRGKAYEFYVEMCNAGLMYHPDDSPEDICGRNCTCHLGGEHHSLFTPEEINELNTVSELIWKDTDGDPCGVAYQVAVDRGDILEN